MRHQGILGNNMWVTYQWFQVTTGTGYPVLEYPDTLKLPHAEGDWFIALQGFLSASNLAIYIPNVYTVQFRRTRDRILMEDALQYGEYTNDEIRQINRARLFLQVETLSDVSNALGTELQKDLWSKTSMVQSQSTMLWPKKVHQDHKLEQHGGSSFKGTRHRKVFINCSLHSATGRI